MAKPGLNEITTAQTFQTWLDRTNELVEIIATDTITASALGDTTTGNATLIGSFTANTVTAVDILRTDVLSPKIGSTSITISSPVSINSSGQTAHTLVSAAGPRSLYSSGSVIWTTGFENTSTNKFIINTGAGAVKFALSADGDLSISGSISINGSQVTASANELNILDGVTATTAEINKLGGLTASTTELNILDGVTATTAEINKLDGVTASTTELNILDGLTASTTELNILDGVTATTAEINKLDGLTSSTTELNYVDGVTSPIQNQINGKYTAQTLITSVWQSGTSTTETLVSPAKIKSAILALAPRDFIGDGQSWAAVSRTSGVTYRNTTGRSIQLLVQLSGYTVVEGGGEGISTPHTTTLQVSTNGSAWLNIASSSAIASPVIPNMHYYRYIGSSGASDGVATVSILS